MRIHALRHLAGQLASVEVWVVLGLIAVTLARPQWGVAALALLALLWLARWLGTGRLSVRTGLDWCVAGMLLALPLALWISADLPASLSEAARLILGVGLLYAAANSAVRGWRFQAAVGVVVVAGAGLALLGLAGATQPAGQVFTLPQALVDLELPFRIHANVLASALVLTLPLAGSLALWGGALPWPRWSQLAAGLASAVMLLALLLSQSRGAYLGLLAAALGMIALRWRRTRWIIAGLFVVGVIVVLTSQRLAGVFMAGLLGREEVWLRAMAAIADFPFSGIGIGLFEDIVPIVYPFFLLGAGPAARATHAHNLLLQVGVDLGLPGMVGFLAVLIAAAGLLAWLWRGAAVPADRPLVWGLSGSMIALAVHGAVDAVSWSARISPLVWLLLGLIVVLPQRALWRLSAS